MKIRKISLIVAIILFTQSLYSQDNYASGYVITTINDTINGFILDDIDAELALKISFKNNESNDAITEYNPTELLGFGFSSGRIFERKMVKKNSATSDENQFIFAKRIVKGKMDLFVWPHNNNKSKDFFIVNNSSKKQAQLTKPKKNEVMLDGKNYLEEDNRYKNLITSVKDNQSQTPEKNSKLRYSEKSIKKNIITYDNNYQEQFPVKIYREPYKYTYDILVGLPFAMKSDEVRFRVGVYRSKTFVDKSRKISYINGIVYQHSSDKNLEWNNEYRYGTSNYNWQMLNLIPIGIKYQTNAKKIIPYGYIGLGAAVIFMKDYVIYDYEITGSENQLSIIPTVNIGAGVKIKVKSNFILAEITPTINGVFFNLGYSF